MLDLRLDLPLIRGNQASVLALMKALQAQVPADQKDTAWSIRTERMGNSRKWTRFSFLGVPIYELEEGERVPKGEPPILMDLRKGPENQC